MNNPVLKMVFGLFLFWVAVVQFFFWWGVTP